MCVHVRLYVRVCIHGARKILLSRLLSAIAFFGELCALSLSLSHSSAGPNDFQCRVNCENRIRARDSFSAASLLF